MTGVLVALIGAVATILGALLASRATIRSAEIEAGKKHEQAEEASDVLEVLKRYQYRVPVSIVLLALVVGGVLGLGSVALAQRITSNVRIQILGDLSALRTVKTLSIVELGDSLDTLWWQSIEGTKTNELAKEKAPGRGEDGALRFRVDLRPQREAIQEFAGVRIDYEDLPSDLVELAVAWIYVPKTESSARARLRAQAVANLEGAEQRFLGMYGKEIALQPGEWVPVVWGSSHTIRITPAPDATQADPEPASFEYKEPRRLSNFDIIIWATEASYAGSVYVDDAKFFQGS